MEQKESSNHNRKQQNLCGSSTTRSFFFWPNIFFRNLFSRMCTHGKPLKTINRKFGAAESRLPIKFKLCKHVWDSENGGSFQRRVCFETDDINDSPVHFCPLRWDPFLWFHSLKCLWNSLWAEARCSSVTLSRALSQPQLDRGSSWKPSVWLIVTNCCKGSKRKCLRLEWLIWMNLSSQINWRVGEGKTNPCTQCSDARVRNLRQIALLLPMREKKLSFTYF